MSRLLESAVTATLATPFEPPRLIEVEAGRTIAEIVEAACAEGVIDKGVRPLLVAFLDDEEVSRSAWTAVTPAPSQLLSLRVRPGAALVEFAWQVVVNIAVAAVVNTVVKAFTPDPSTEAQEQVYDIRGASNEVALYRPVPAVLGAFRVFPPHAAKAYTEAFGETVYLRLLLCWGLGPVDLDVNSLKIGDTAITNFAGVQVQHRLKPSDPWPNLFPSAADEDEGPGLVEAVDGWVQRTSSSSQADELQVETFFPEGLVRVKDDGSTDSVSVEFRVRYRAAGASTWLSFATGAPDSEGALYSFTKRTRKPFRETHRRLVARGRYEIAYRRVSADPTSPNVHNLISWSRLRSFTFEKAVSDDNLAVTAVRIEAGEQLNGIVDQFNGVVTRRAPIWNAAGGSWGGDGPTRNPAELVRWIALGPGSAKPRTASEIDDAAFGAWAELCSARGWRCDMELRAGASLDEILQTVARCGRSVMGERAGRLTPIVDDTQAAAAQLFTPRNSWGLRVQRRYPGETHALRLEFNNEDKSYARDEMVVYFDGYTAANAELIETVAAVGKTRPVEVYRDGRRAIAERILRQEEFSWRADIENLACARGQRVRLAHFAMVVGRKSARVKARVLNGAATHVTALQLDEQIEQVVGQTYGLNWRRVEGATITVEALALSNTGVTTDTVTLAAATPVASAPPVGALVVFGDGGIETLDLVVQDIARASAFEAELTALRYTGNLFADDATALPAWSSNVSGLAFRRPPAPEIVSVTATPDAIFARFEFSGSGEELVREVEAAWRPADDDGATFELASVLPGIARLARYPAGIAGKSYVLKLVAVGERERSPGAETVITGAAAGDALSLVRSFAVSQAGRTLTKESGPAAWDAQAYSVDSVAGGATAFARAVRTDAAAAFGLTADPSASAGYATIAFAVMLEADGTWRVTENGVTAWDVNEAYAEGDAFSIAIDAASVRYYRNDVLKRQATTTAGRGRLYFAASFFALGSALSSVSFQASSGLIDGRAADGLDANGDLARDIPAGRANSSHLLRRTGGGLFAGELDADRTSAHVAAGIAAQGALATRNTVGAAQIDAASVTASKVAITDRSNLIADPDFLDASYWSAAGGVTFASTDAAITTLLGAPRGVRTANGNGAPGQASVSLANVAAQYFALEPGRPYRLASKAYVSFGFTGRLRIGALWYRQDGSASATPASYIIGPSYLMVPASGEMASALDGIVVAPSDAYYGRFQFLAEWSTTLNNAGFGCWAVPRFQRVAQLASTVVREDGATPLTDALVVTSLGVASGIVAQGAGATANSLAQLNAGDNANLNAALHSAKRLIVSDFSADGRHWTTAFGGSPEAIADPIIEAYVDVANAGRAARFDIGAGGKYLTPKGVIKPAPGRRYLLVARARAQADSAGGAITIGFNVNGLDTAWNHGVPSVLNWTAARGFAQQNTNLTVAAGWVNIANVVTAYTASTYDAYWRPRFGMTQTGTGGRVEIVYFDVLDVTDVPVSRSLVDLLRADGSTPVTEAALVTDQGVASGIVAQGLLATRSDVDWGAHVAGRPAELTDGRVAAALDVSGRMRGAWRGSNPLITGATAYRSPINPLTSVDAGTSATINIAAHTLSTSDADGATKSASYNAGSIAGRSFSTGYHVFAYDPAFAGGTVTYVAATSSQTYITNSNYVYVGYIVTVADGGSGGSSPPPPPEFCVAADAWMDDVRRAADIGAGDRIDCLDGDGFAPFAVDGATFAVTPGVRLISSSCVTLTCSNTTPITQRSGAIVRALNALGCEVAVVDAAGFRWEHIAKVEPVGPIRVRRIHVGGRTYAAGDQLGRRMFTHNPMKP